MSLFSKSTSVPLEPWTTRVLSLTAWRKNDREFYNIYIVRCYSSRCFPHVFFRIKAERMRKSIDCHATLHTCEERRYVEKDETKLMLCACAFGWNYEWVDDDRLEIATSPSCLSVVPSACLLAYATFFDVVCVKRNTHTLEDKQEAGGEYRREWKRLKKSEEG